MSKERLIAFFDAVLAIIMTILILELEKPSEISLRGFLSIKEGFFAYALSFFWLGTMWINYHNEWVEVEKISVKTVWTTIIVLFMASFFPYATAQLFYGIVIIGTTIAVIINYITLLKPNQNNKKLVDRIRKRNLLLKYDLIVKVIAFLTSAFIYPPAMMIGLIITLLFVGFIIPKLQKAIK